MIENIHRHTGNLLQWYACVLTDPNVEVIYICPVQVNDETLQYYAKLMGLRSAVNSGNVEDQTDVTPRYKIIKFVMRIVLMV